MPSSALSPRRLYHALEAVVFLAVIGAAAATSQPDDWHPVLLAALLILLAGLGQRLNSSVGGGQLTTAHIAIVLAMALLGPAPAVFAGVVVACVASAPRRISASGWLNNLFTYALYPFVGAMLIQLTVGDVDDPANAAVIRSLPFGLLVFGVFMFTLGLNFLLVAIDVWFDEGVPLLRQTREAFIPPLPGHLAAGALAGLLAVAYTNLGLTVLFAAVLVLLIFHYLTLALLRSEDRADQLEARSIHLANLQFGVLSMLMDALALRDRSTSRHAASVARYAKALAEDLELSEEDQEVVHTAALLHDIGKFAWSDRVLYPDQLTDEDWAVIRRHPQDGAALVGKLDGYGPVADAILYHHERVDGGGYPAGLIANEIPLASRIVAICSTYDTMVTGGMAGNALTPAEAAQELRAGSGHQFDGDLVERFLGMLKQRGWDVTSPTEDVDYATELAFERRVRKMAHAAER
jgi:putative nucleotidyltransferase with HDIG domain